MTLNEEPGDDRPNPEGANMTRREWTHVDKSTWGPGPWQDEPDKVQWTDEATGLPCLIHRGPMGALCGYVGVAEGHPMFGVSYIDDRFVEPNIHGGITWTDECQPGADEGHGICHVPEPGQPDHVWWLGFDCAHFGDFMPAYMARNHFEPYRDEVYKDVAYVTAEVGSLACQLVSSSRDTAGEP